MAVVVVVVAELVGVMVDGDCGAGSTTRTYYTY